MRQPPRPRLQTLHLSYHLTCQTLHVLLQDLHDARRPCENLERPLRGAAHAQSNPPRFPLFGASSSTGLTPLLLHCLCAVHPSPYAQPLDRATRRRRCPLPCSTPRPLPCSSLFPRRVCLVSDSQLSRPRWSPRSKVCSLTRRGRNSTASVFAKGVRVSDPTPVRLFPSPQSATSRRRRLRCSPPSTPRGRTRARR
jgi:hypothetical protein